MNPDEQQQIPPDQPQGPADSAQPQAPTSILDKIDKDALSNYVLTQLKNDIRDREALGWTFMRQYDQLAYDGYKQKANDPWTNASNFAVCLTSTLLDTGHANTVGSMYADKNDVVSVQGIGPEDVRLERPMKSLMNWLVLNDIDDAYDTIDKTVHVAYKHANACVKVVQGYPGPQKAKIIWSRVPIENIFIPINARGAQPSQTDHIFELISMNDVDWEQRKTLMGPNGKLVYEKLDDLKKGNGIVASSAIASMQNVKDITSGTSLGEKYSRDMRYFMECYLTYPHTDKETKEVTLVELIVTISPQGGVIHRIAENKDLDENTGEAVRPYSLRWIPYPREDRIYGDSLPWIVKQTQEELDYAHNQVMNAAEELIKPQKFYDPSSGFDPEAAQQVPNGWYPITRPRENLYIREYNFNPIFERSFNLYWEYAQRRTGFTELFQGRLPEKETTLGEAQIRVNKTEIRFKVIYGRFEMGWQELMNLTYYYAKKYLPKETKIRVLGTSDYKSIEELFPNGIKGRFNFRFSSEPLTEKAKKRDNSRVFYEYASANAVVTESRANQWRMLDFLADSLEIPNMRSYIPKPKEAEMLSPQEAIDRIMSGQYDVVPEPGIDAPNYLFRIQAFMKTDTFLNADPQEKQAVAVLLRRVTIINTYQQLAMQDARILEEHARMKGQMSAMPPQDASGGSQPPQELPGAGAPQ